MTNYDYLVLSPEEFENLSRDVLQKVNNFILESFTTGKDQGIDFRYSTADKNIIVQCKRYKSYSDLKSNLKKEVFKAAELSPSQYILVTSLGLTPKNKKDIRKLFNGLILSDSDIVGRDDLNNYLGIYLDIEKKYYKLWLSSVTILERIFHSKIVNQSELEKDTIIRNIKLYVQNQSFIDALDILREHRFVLISGIPGIGKTTLARFLVYYLLGQGIEEFVYVSDSINDAFESFNGSKSQVFFFDDFLGKRNFLKANLATNEDKRIIDFIEFIRRSKNKYLIFSTREYILNQAKTELETLNQIEKEVKCVIDLKKYNKVARGKILYNHLYFLGLPQTHIASLLQDKLFLKLIDHHNYSPRLIESITKKKFWSRIDPDEYGIKLLEYFENPEELWTHAYENQISELSRILLALVPTTDTPVFINDLEMLLQNFSKNTNGEYFQFTHSYYRKSLKELEDTFISIQKDSRDNIIITFQNPSIHDFMCQYLTKEKKLLSDIVSNALFFNQLVVSFTSDKKDKTRIFMNKNLEELIVKRIIDDYEYLGLSVLLTFASPSGYFYQRLNNSNIIKIGYIIERLTVDEYKVLKQFLKTCLFNIKPEELHDEEIESYLRAYDIVKSELDESYDFENLLRNTFEAVKEIENLNYFYAGYWLDESAFENIVKDPVIVEKIENICDSTFQNTSEEDLEELQVIIDEVSSQYYLNLEDIQDSIDQAISEYENNESDQDINEDYRDLYEQSYVSEDKVLENMFESLVVEDF